MEMNELMAQAQALQAKVASAQDLLGKTRIKGIAANGDVIVDMSGKYDLIDLIINPELLKQDAQTVSETIKAAFNDAKAKADATIDKIMGEATAGMPLPE